MQANTGTAEVVNPIIMSEEPGQQLEIPREKIQVNGRQMKPDTTMEMLLINLTSETMTLYLYVEHPVLGETMLVEEEQIPKVRIPDDRPVFIAHASIIHDYAQDLYDAVLMQLVLETLQVKVDFTEHGMRLTFRYNGGDYEEVWDPDDIEAYGISPYFDK